MCRPKTKLKPPTKDELLAINEQQRALISALRDQIAKARAEREFWMRVADEQRHTINKLTNTSTPFKEIGK